MALLVLDASTLIAFLNPTDSLHRRAVLAMAGYESSQIVLPASAYAEVLVGPLRAGGTAPATVGQVLRALAIRVEPLGEAAARRAAALRAAHAALRLPDALVLATADQLEAEVVLTGDVSWSKISRRVQVI